MLYLINEPLGLRFEHPSVEIKNKVLSLSVYISLKKPLGIICDSLNIFPF